MRLAALLFVAGFVALGALSGCKKNKGDKTTPDGAGGNNAVGMNDDGTVIDGSGGGGGGDGGTGDGGGGDGSILPDDGGEPPLNTEEITAGAGDGTGEPGFETVAPPNLDPDPEAARTSVDKHLRTGRDALKGAKPDADKAIAEAKAALAIDGTSIDAVVVLAHGYYHKKLYDTAETILDMLYKDREASHKHPGVFYVYGLVYEKLGRAEAAQKAFEKAVDLKPNYGSALVNVGVYQLRNKQYADAIDTFEKLVNDLGYNDAKTWNSLGSAYRGRSGDYDPGSSPKADWILKADNAYKKAMQIDGEYGIVYYNLGVLYLDADPFPLTDGGNLDTLKRLQKAQAYFDEYKNRPGVDMDLYDERIKNVTKLIKREEKKRKKATEKDE